MAHKKYLTTESKKKAISNNNKRYEKTRKGFLVRCYRNMKSRVLGIQKLKAHLYKGKSLLNKDVFYEWSLNNDSFNDLFREWELSGYDRKLCPSVDRLDSSLGYDLSNMEWVTHSENSRRGCLSRYKKLS